MIQNMSNPRSVSRDHSLSPGFISDLMVPYSMTLPGVCKGKSDVPGSPENIKTGGEGRALSPLRIIGRQKLKMTPNTEVAGRDDAHDAADVPGQMPATSILLHMALVTSLEFRMLKPSSVRRSLPRPRVKDFSRRRSRIFWCGR